MPLFSLIIIGFSGWAIWWGWMRDLRPLEHRSISTFRVTPEVIESNGRSFKKDAIHRLIIKNGITHDVRTVPGVLIQVPTAMAMGGTQRCAANSVYSPHACFLEPSAPLCHCALAV